MVTTWLASEHVRTSESHDDRLQDAPAPHTNTRTYTHKLFWPVHVGRADTPLLGYRLQAVRPVTVAVVGGTGGGEVTVP
jgi:hypothetical protein